MAKGSGTSIQREPGTSRVQKWRALPTLYLLAVPTTGTSPGLHDCRDQQSTTRGSIELLLPEQHMVHMVQINSYKNSERTPPQITTQFLYQFLLQFKMKAKYLSSGRVLESQLFFR